jgi:valyl-tRNA synthetase
VTLYQKGLIYKGSRIINWCPTVPQRCPTRRWNIRKTQPSLHLRYPVKDSEEYVVVATTRPETMLGGHGGAVHPRTPGISTWWERR